MMTTYDATAPLARPTNADYAALILRLSTGVPRAPPAISPRSAFRAFSAI